MPGRTEEIAGLLFTGGGSVPIVGRAFLTPYFMKIPYIAYPLLKFCPTHTHTHTHTHIHKDTQRTQGPTDWHTHINLLTPLVLCAHSSFLYWMNNLLISTSTMSFLFQNYSLVEAMICWLDAVRLSSSCETQVILIEMVWINKIHTQTPLREIKHWKRLVSMKIKDTSLFHNNPLFYQPLLFMGKIQNPWFQPIMFQPCWLTCFFPGATTDKNWLQ